MMKKFENHYRSAMDNLTAPLSKADTKAAEDMVALQAKPRRNSNLAARIGSSSTTTSSFSGVALFDAAAAVTSKK